MLMNLEDFSRVQGRRRFLQECSGGLGTIALWNLMALEGRAGSQVKELPHVNPLEPKAPHFAARAKNVIFLFMEGGPSQLDLFDPKPELQKWNGHPLPESMAKNLDLAFIKPTAKIWPCPREFKH